MCFEINGLENLKLTILRFLSLEPPLTHTTLIVVKTFFIVETLFIIHKFTWIHIIFTLIFWNVFFEGAIILEFMVAD